MNKPLNCVCSRTSDRSKTVYSLLADKYSDNTKLHTIGRLDKNTSGLLLFTTDGKLSNYLTRPESKIEKKYLVELSQPVNKKDKLKYVEQSLHGVLLPEEKKSPEETAGPALITWITSAQCTIKVTEGKFHEIRRIFRALGNEVKRLERISFASISIPDYLKSGDYRELDKEEITKLYSLYENCKTAQA
jgi:16S rRNA pseudouridine516 synthase